MSSRSNNSPAFSLSSPFFWRKKKNSQSKGTPRDDTPSSSVDNGPAPITPIVSSSLPQPLERHVRHHRRRSDLSQVGSSDLVIDHPSSTLSKPVSRVSSRKHQRCNLRAGGSFVLESSLETYSALPLHQKIRSASMPAPPIAETSNSLSTSLLPFPPASSKELDETATNCVMELCFTERGMRYLAITSQVLPRKYSNQWFQFLFELWVHNGVSSDVFVFLDFLLQHELEVISRLPSDDIDAVNTLFRATNPFTSFLTLVSASLGHTYLMNIITLYIGRLSFHRDSNITGKELFGLCYESIFLENLLTSVSNVPIPLRRIYAKIAQGVGPKFPQVELDVVSSIFFLRFVCPALLDPSEKALWNTMIAPAVKDALVLSCKALQRSSKMLRSSKFIDDGTSTRGRISQFICDLIAVDLFEPTPDCSSIPNSHLNISALQYREFIAILSATQRDTERWISDNANIRFLSHEPDSLLTLHSTLDRAVANMIRSGELE